MIEILQGETLGFVLSASDLDGEDLRNFQVRAALVLIPEKVQNNTFRRDCICQPAPQSKSMLNWLVDVDNYTGAAKWILTSQQSLSLPVGKYAMEVALRDKVSQQEIKNKTIEIIEVKASYTV